MIAFKCFWYKINILCVTGEPEGEGEWWGDEGGEWGGGGWEDGEGGSEWGYSEHHGDDVGEWEEEEEGGGQLPHDHKPHDEL